MLICRNFINIKDFTVNAVVLHEWMTGQYPAVRESIQYYSQGERDNKNRLNFFFCLDFNVRKFIMYQKSET